MSKTKEAFMNGEWPGQPGPGELPVMHEPQDELIMPTSVFQKELFRQSVKNRILGGTLNPLEFYRQAKLITDCIDDLKKDSDIFDCAYSERLKYGKEKPTVNGSIVDISSRTTYDYGSCGDPVYDQLKEKIKSREQFLKSLPPEGTVDPESGLFIKPPVTKESQFFTVKI
jgi:hypothetical protein